MTLGAVAGCAPVTNFIDPQAPRFAGAYGGAREATRADGVIRVVTFNIRYGQAIDSAIALLGESPALRDADVIALQEMDERGVDRVARALGLNYIYYPSSVHPVSGGNFGPALLSRWPIERAWKLLLPHEGAVRRQRRSATAAVIAVEGEPVRVYTVHLEVRYRITERQREDQIGAILQDALAACEPVVILGDFNDRTIGRFVEQNGYRWLTRRVGRTISLFSWDHIFARGLVPVDSASAGSVADVRDASDHRPVWAALRAPPRSHARRRDSGCEREPRTAGRLTSPSRPAARGATAVLRGW